MDLLIDLFWMSVEGGRPEFGCPDMVRADKRCGRRGWFWYVSRYGVRICWMCFRAPLAIGSRGVDADYGTFLHYGMYGVVLSFAIRLGEKRCACRFGTFCITVCILCFRLAFDIGRRGVDADFGMFCVTVCVLFCFPMAAGTNPPDIVQFIEKRREGRAGGGGGEGGGTHVLLALVICPLTMHPFRDEAPFLLLIETPPTFGLSLRFFHILHK